jgi:hypothetical protein
MNDVNTDTPELDLIWGASAIARHIKLTDRQTFYMLEHGRIPGRKVGGKWCAERGALRRFFLGENA